VPESFSCFVQLFDVKIFPVVFKYSDESCVQSMTA
jgi:hypothetical protein